MTLTLKDKAERLDAEIQHEFGDYRKKGGLLWKKIQFFVDTKQYVNLGMNEEQWLESRFSYSASSMFEKLRHRRALRGVPEAQIEKIPNGNAQQLLRLPEKIRKSPKVIEQAIDLKPKQFKEVVDDIRETKLGIKQEPWKTFVVRMPEAVYDKLIAAQDKVARMLQLDLSDDEKRPWHLITIWECVAQLVNDTPEERLRVETEGVE